MAKNRSDRPHKAKDNFFKKSRSNFRNSKPQFKNRNEDRADSSASSGSFFVQPIDAGSFPKTKTSKAHAEEKSVDKLDKKPFDKKKYRFEKYSNKYKLEQWEQRRKIAVLRNYYKNVNDDGGTTTRNIYETVENNEKEATDGSDRLKPETGDETKAASPQNSKQRKNKSFRKAHEEFQRIKEEREKKQELFSKQKLEKEEALLKYKKKKIEKYKKLNKKNKRGQPIMKGRLEMLLEKIQSSIE